MINSENGVGVFCADNNPFNMVNGREVLKVVEPFYCSDRRIISAFCPHCGLEVNRVWCMEYCGNCGGQISWHNLHVAGYGDIE